MKNRRLTVLMIEEDGGETLPTRKLLVESLKHNVLSAFSAEEGLELFRINSIDMVCIHENIRDLPCNELVRQIKSMRNEVPVTLISSFERPCDGIDSRLDGGRPIDLVECIRQTAQRFGKLGD